MSLNVQDSQPNPQASNNSQTGSPHKAYLDTTVVANALLRSDDIGKRCASAIRDFKYSEMPEYALKEFKAGPLAAWIWCHNKFNETRSFADTLSAINVMSATPKRNFSSSARQAFEQAAHADKAAFTQALELQDYSGGFLDRALADRHRYYLRRRIIQAWERRRGIATAVSMPLECFIEGTLQVENDGRLSFERYSCPRDSKCSVAIELSKRQNDVKTLMDVISERLGKAENQRRYQALRQIYRTPTKSYSDSLCRGLGDAVFAIMAPSDCVIVTTNIRDHAPLANALGKDVFEPTAQAMCAKTLEQS